MVDIARRRDKRTSLAEAVAHVRDGARVALGGFAVYERPMAFARELVRQNKRDLTIVGHVNGLEVDLLAAAGALRRVETSYVGLERHGLAPHFSCAVAAGTVEFVPYSEMLAFDRFRANQAGLSFWPAYHLAGTDLLEGNPDIVAMTCPLTGRSMHAVRPADPDVVVLHAGRADHLGNVAFPAERQLSHSLDIILSQSCETVIVTAEEIVAPEVLAQQPHLVELAAFRTTAVVHAPRGAHPCSVLGYYGADHAGFTDYLAGARDPASAQAHARAFSAASEAAYQDAVGAAQARRQAEHQGAQP